tara:strand:- start:938 stop:1543 length:606 start_codon:yes stop_codon:yes gene_type:complete
MVENDIKKRGILDPLVLDALNTVKRELFVPNKYRDISYNDHPLPIGYNQTISQPYIVAFMTEYLQVRRNHKVLEIGTGSGYQAAVLSLLADQVFTIEIIESLGDMARTILKKNNYNNVIVRIGNGYEGWEKEAPFDRIIVTAAPEKIPTVLVDQLKNGGRMIIPIGQTSLEQHLWLIEKNIKGIITKEKILPVRFVPMVHE